MGLMKWLFEMQRIRELKYKVEHGDEKAIQQAAVLRSQMDRVRAPFLCEIIIFIFIITIISIIFIIQCCLSQEEQAEKDRLLREGFADWSKSDYRHFIQACETHGRANPTAIIEMLVTTTGKTRSDIQRYMNAFWKM